MPVTSSPFGDSRSDANWPGLTYAKYKPDTAKYIDDAGAPMNYPADYNIQDYFGTSITGYKGPTTPPNYNYITQYPWVVAKVPSSSITLGRVVRSRHFHAILDAINYEARRRFGAYIMGNPLVGPTVPPTLAEATSPPTVYGGQTLPTTVGSTIYAIHLNRWKDGIETDPPALGTAGVTDIYGVQTQAGYYDSTNTYVRFPQAYGYKLAWGGTASGALIQAFHFSALIDKLSYANAVCVCNCNYCTCNCNYCTCDCNYACTCNCNYSDERLKEGVEYLAKP